MKRFWLLMLMIAPHVAPSITAASAQSPATRTEEEAIKALMFQTTDAFNKQPAHRELSIRVVVYERGVWRITAFHNTIVQP